jgi:hypothetical protein
MSHRFPRLHRLAEGAQWLVAPIVESWTIAGYIHWFLLGLFALVAIVMFAIAFRLMRK